MSVVKLTLNVNAIFHIDVRLLTLTLAEYPEREYQ